MIKENLSRLLVRISWGWLQCDCQGLKWRNRVFHGTPEITGWDVLCVNGVCAEHLQDEPPPPHRRAGEGGFQDGVSVLGAMHGGSFFPLKEPCLAEHSQVSGDVLLILDPLWSSGCLSTAEPRKERSESFCMTDAPLAAVRIGDFSKGKSCVFLKITFGK